MVSRLADQDTAWLSMLLQPRREVGGVSDCSIVHPQIVADRTDDHWASVDAYANRKLRAASTKLRSPLR